MQLPLKSYIIQANAHKKEILKISLSFYNLLIVSLYKILYSFLAMIHLKF